MKHIFPSLMESLFVFNAFNYSKGKKVCTNISMHKTFLYLGSFTYSGGEGNGNPLQYSCLENPMDRGAW